MGLFWLVFFGRNVNLVWDIHILMAPWLRVLSVLLRFYHSSHWAQSPKCWCLWTIVEREKISHLLRGKSVCEALNGVASFPVTFAPSSDLISTPFPNSCLSGKGREDVKLWTIMTRRKPLFKSILLCGTVCQKLPVIDRIIWIVKAGKQNIWMVVRFHLKE